MKTSLENSEIKQKVKTRNGALTSQLRYNWGVEAKNRDKSKVLLHGKIWSISTYPSSNSLSISIDCLE
jgi:hypothetical protein